MKELIKSLSEQAGIKLVNGSYGLKVTVPSDVALTRFVELIVQECAQVSLKSSHRDDDMGAIIAQNIKKEFGFNEPVKHDSPSITVEETEMRESNGRVTHIVWLAKTGDNNPLNWYQIYSSSIKGRAEYEAANLRHFLGQGPAPDILAFNTSPTS